MTAPSIGIAADAAYRRVDEDAVVERLLLNGWSFEVRAGRREFAEAEVRESLERLTAAGLGFKSSPGGGRRFDPFEVINVMEWAGQVRGDPFWESCSVATARRLVLEQHGIAYRPGMGPPPPRALGPRRFQVNFRREFSLTGHTVGRADGFACRCRSRTAR